MSSRQQRNTINEEESTIFRSVPRAPASVGMAPLPSIPAPLGLRPLGAPKRSLELPSKPTMSTSAAAPSSLTWKLDEDSIPTVPEYPLERTNMTCNASMSLDQITQRIARVLEAANLQCMFHDDESASFAEDEEILSGRVDCTSQHSDLKIVVQLWRSHTKEIIVEVQRRRGDAMAFSAVRKPLFRTLQSSTGAFAAGPKKFTPPPFIPNKKFRVLPPSMMAV
ncbi:expressed unknown protein [Seminavis robusta]|uniref:Uncharacterized protein n=1 Tax=Seminavis robusta TaxID=568900 RepID=A0A9N8E438_9STRA|nr:expressed unknown protein [Seminavis robusta]|eukprot:Sro504_g155940.1 n/a (223) ;mRNA; r:15648-16316